jgi:hypothetical protein
VKEKTMAKKKMFLGMLAMAFGFVVMGCETPLQDGGTVKIGYDKASGVAGVTATVTTSNLTGQEYKGVIVAWDAVDNAGGYQLYAQQEGKKNILNLNASPQYRYTYASDNGATTANSDIDKYSVLVSLQPDRFQSGKKYRFGIRTNSSQSGFQPSDIVWSEYKDL